MRDATPSKKEGVGPLANTANLSLSEYIIKNTKKIKTNLENINMKSYLKEAKINNKTVIFN
jgi:hypothetical protein